MVENKSNSAADDFKTGFNRTRIHLSKGLARKALALAILFFTTPPQPATPKLGVLRTVAGLIVLALGQPSRLRHDH